ncbi:MAG: lipase family protein [Verrucomicrobia bacterium]|nr:lipase family protein [Verrucomicrobiota bacterium]
MNPTEALLCAKAAEAIYGNPEDPVGQATSQAALAAEGFAISAWIDLQTIFKDVCAFVASSANYNLLVFRGTKVPQDWMEDLYCTPARFEWLFAPAPPLGEIHAGFGHTLADGLSEIISSLAPRDQTKPLLVTGHSLGGALAALVGACFVAMSTAVRPVSGIYTFGQPRIGLHDFCNTYGRLLGKKLVRFVNQRDLVPRVPFRNWDYSDEGTMIHFDSSGKPSIQAAEWQTFLSRTLESLGDFFEIMGHIRVDVGDHSITTYRQLVEENQNSLLPLLQ